MTYMLWWICLRRQNFIKEWLSLPAAKIQKHLLIQHHRIGCSCSHASMIGKIRKMADCNISLKKSKTSGECRTILLLTLLLAFSLPLVSVLIVIGAVLASLNEINCSS